MEALLSNLKLEPGLLQLIQSCKLEEERRKEEEAKTKLKEYQVLCELQYLKSKGSFQLKLPHPSL